MNNEIISSKKMLNELRGMVRRLGGPAAAAREWGISPQAVSNAINCTKLPGPQILAQLELEPVKEIKYRYKRK